MQTFNLTSLQGHAYTVQGHRSVDIQYLAIFKYVLKFGIFLSLHDLVGSKWHRDLYI